MKKALVALGIASAACATVPVEKTIPLASPKRPFFEILFADGGGSCELLHKSSSRTVSKSSGTLIFRIVNDCATAATGNITLENFRVGGKPVDCLNRTEPGSVAAQRELTYPTRVHRSRSAGETCTFEVHVDGQKADPQIVIIP